MAGTMIAFGCSVSEPEPYHRYAEPGIRSAMEHDSIVYAFAAVGSISRSYNVVLDAAARRDDLEALVLIHPHTEIADPDFCAKLRRTLADPEVAVVGCVGATGVQTIAWWEGSTTRSSVVHRYGELGGGEFPAFNWTGVNAPLYEGNGEVEVVDGFLFALSPWAVRNLRFDETLSLGHGFDVDYCLQARAAGRKIIATDVRAIYHRSLELVADRELWVESHMQVAEKWGGRMPADGEGDVDWKKRARRAEAEREAARAMAHSNALMIDARVLELERRLEERTDTMSWRLTEPLRRANLARRTGLERLRRREDA